MSDLIERWKGHGCSFCNYDTTELTDEIERLTTKLEKVMRMSRERNETNNIMADEIERLTGQRDRLGIEYDDAQKEIDRLRAALLSIAANTCCSPCQEAALVAREALATAQEGE